MRGKENEKKISYIRGYFAYGGHNLVIERTSSNNNQYSLDSADTYYCGFGDGD